MNSRNKLKTWERYIVKLIDDKTRPSKTIMNVNDMGPEISNSHIVGLPVQSELSCNKHFFSLSPSATRE